MAKLLIVDDELKIREVVKEYALINEHTIDEADDGIKALEMINSNNYDCIILDIMLPKLDGFSVLKEIRKNYDTPVIILSARQEEYDKLHGFDIGVDDYVVKPFSPKELMARVKVVLDRKKINKNKTYKFDGLIIDTSGRTVSIDGVKANLTPKEIDLLIYMVRNKNIALSREKILSEVWNYDYFGDDRTVDTHIKMLRHNLGRYRSFIVTVRGMGYKFEIES
ncbi:MAG: response regulator transcription factor [Erysipelotrichaceae bacterium]|jgi:DNA-binding response OmpR family regulator|nr:response regulator transcription factor [Bacillota bacterium]